MNEKIMRIFWFFIAVFAIVAAAWSIFIMCGKAANDEDYIDESTICPTIIVPEVEMEEIEDPDPLVNYVNTSNEHQFVYSVRPDVLPVDPQDLEMLACVIYQEAGCDWISNETRMMVGNVVLNRVASDLFPNTIEEVLLQQGQYGEYSWTGIHWLSSAEYEPWAVARCYECAQRLLEGERVFHEGVVWQAGFIQGQGIEEYRDGIYFCY